MHRYLPAVLACLPLMAQPVPGEYPWLSIDGGHVEPGEMRATKALLECTV